MRGNAQHVHRAFFPASTSAGHEPLLLLNSLATTTEIWSPILPRLTSATDVVCVDYPGHGHSPSRNFPANLDELAAQIVDTIDEFDIDRVHVAGVSIGGMTAIQLAATVPDRISSIAVIGSTPIMELDMWLARKEVVRKHGTRGVVPEVLPRWFTPEYMKEHPDVVAAYTAMLEGTTDEAYGAFCAVLGGADLRPKLPDVKCPTVVVSGGRDQAATVEQGRIIASGIPGARQVVIDTAAHMLQAMAADRVADTIIENVVDPR